MNALNFFAIGKHVKQLEELQSRFDAIAKDKDTQPREKRLLDATCEHIGNALHALEIIAPE